MIFIGKTIPGLILLQNHPLDKIKMSGSKSFLKRWPMYI